MFQHILEDFRSVYPSLRGPHVSKPSDIIVETEVSLFPIHQQENDNNNEEDTEYLEDQILNVTALPHNLKATTDQHVEFNLIKDTNNKRLLEIIANNADGNRLFNLISILLFGISDKANHLRMLTIRKIWQMKDQIKDIGASLIFNDQQLIDTIYNTAQHIPPINRSGWGKNVHMQMIAESFNRMVACFQFNSLTQSKVRQCRTLDQVLHVFRTFPVFTPYYPSQNTVKEALRILLNDSHFEPIVKVNQ